MAVSDVSGLTNVIGLATLVNTDISSFAGAVWMTAEGEKVFPTPPTPTPTATPTPTPTDGDGDGGTPTSGGAPGGGSGGGSSCAISGPVQASTALANMLIVLLPAVGFALRRKLKRS